MASHIAHSIIYGDVFGTERMREIFSDEGLVRRWLEVEVALAAAEAKAGVIPQWAAEEIRNRAVPGNIDLSQLRADTSVVGYPILPLVRQLAAACEGGAGQYVHWGATTQDIMDTAAVLQMRDALILVRDDLIRIEDSLISLALTHRDTPMAGRTHGQQALPITFGFKAAVWLAEIHRHLKRLKELAHRTLAGQLGGAVGTLASLGERAREVQALFFQELGLAPPEIAWHVARDRVAEVMCFLGMLTATLSKIAYEIALLSRSEVGEVREPFVLGRGASSTMPQKRNPVGAEAVIAIGKLVREQVPVALDCMVVDGERSTGTWMAEWEIVPSSFILASAAMHHIAVLLEGLEIDTERMHRNLGITRGLIMAEAVMMALATEVGRQQAHDLVYEACRKAEQSGKELLDTVREDPVLSQFLPWEKLRGLLDPTRYTGRAAEFVETVVSTVKRERGDVSKW